MTYVYEVSYHLDQWDSYEIATCDSLTTAKRFAAKEYDKRRAESGRYAGTVTKLDWEARHTMPISFKNRYWVALVTADPAADYSDRRRGYHIDRVKVLTKEDVK